MKEGADVTIEFSHVYADQEVGETQIVSMRHARRVVRQLESEGKRVLSLVLLDDIHVSQAERSVDDIKREMERHGGQIDAVIRESDVIRGVDTFLRSLCDSRLRLESFRSTNKQVVFLNVGEESVALGSRNPGVFVPTCALLVAVWHLARLGEITVPGIPPAPKSLTILEERYRDVERKAIMIIKASRFAHAAAKIEHIFL